MNWYYADGTRQIGPLTDTQLNELVRTGRIRSETLVWRPGLTQWQAYGQLMNAPVGANSPDAMAGCLLCLQMFPVAEMVSFQNGWVCGACKPVYVQRLKEGAPLLTNSQIGRAGSSLVMHKEALLPERCVRCNAPSSFWLKRRLSWHPPAWYALILINLLVYAIVAASISKRATIQVGLCAQHRAKRVRDIWIAWGLVGVSVGLFILAGVLDSGGPVLPAVLLLLASPIYGLSTARVVAVRKIANNKLWLKGVCAEYLAGLPEWET